MRHGAMLHHIFFSSVLPSYKSKSNTRGSVKRSNKSQKKTQLWTRLMMNIPSQLDLCRNDMGRETVLDLKIFLVFTEFPEGCIQGRCNVVYQCDK